MTRRSAGPKLYGHLGNTDSGLTVTVETWTPEQAVTVLAVTKLTMSETFLKFPLSTILSGDNFQQIKV